MASNVDTEMVGVKQEILCIKEMQFPHLIHKVELKFIHPWVKNLHFVKEVPKFSLAEILNNL